MCNKSYFFYDDVFYIINIILCFCTICSCMYMYIVYVARLKSLFFGMSSASENKCCIDVAAAMSSPMASKARKGYGSSQHQYSSIELSHKLRATTFAPCRRVGLITLPHTCDKLKFINVCMCVYCARVTERIFQELVII